MEKHEITTLVSNLNSSEVKELLEQIKLRFGDVVAEVLEAQKNGKNNLSYGKVEPISPKQVKVKIPDVVFEAVNELINENGNRDEIVLKQDEIVKRILKLAKKYDLHITEDKIFKKHRLDFEDFYRKKGRKVDYDKPAYCENYPSTFSFSKPSKKQYII